MPDPAAGDPPQPPGWNAAQRARLERYGVPRSVDLHCHCLPGLDDGPPDLATAIELCRALADDGVTSVVATPHQLGNYDLENSSERVRTAVRALEEELEAQRVPLELVPGADVRIDERLARLIADGEALTLGDLGAHLLLELPNSVYCEPRGLIKRLAGQGVQCLVTHPERHRYLAGSLDTAAGWLQAGAVIQLTAGSLLGDFGRYAFDYAWRLLQEGMASVVATDAHCPRRRPPRMSAALATIEQNLGPDMARTVCIDNPLRVWRGEPIPVPLSW